MAGQTLSPTWQKVLIGIVIWVIIMIALGGWWLYRSNQRNNALREAQIYTATVQSWEFKSQALLEDLNNIQTLSNELVLPQVDDTVRLY